MLLDVLRFGKRLWQLGYLQDVFGTSGDPPSTFAKLSPELVMNALKAFCDFNGIDINDNRLVETMLTTRHRCALPDIMAARDKACKWPHLDVRWYINISLNEMTNEKILEAFKVAYRQWGDVCGVRPQLVTSAEVANIYSKAGRGRKNQLDGRGGTLAWSELPCGYSSNDLVNQMYDVDEAWDFNMLVGVACHEIGHALGLSHSTRGNLMAPYYDAGITKPQSGDIQQIIQLYGRSAPTPTPTPPTPTPPTTTDILVPNGLVTIGGQVYRLSKVA